MGSVVVRQKGSWVLLLVGLSGWVACGPQRAPTLVLQADGYSNSSLNQLKPPVPHGVPVDATTAFGMHEWEGGTLRLELQGADADLVYRSLALAEEQAQGRTGMSSKTGVHLQCLKRTRGTRCTLALNLPEGSPIPVRAPGDLISANPEPRIPDENGELIEVHPEAAGGHLTLRIPLLFSAVLYSKLPDSGVSTRMGSHLTCTQDPSRDPQVSCWIDIDPKRAALFPMKGRN
jgi:hypothetical protein